MILVRAALAGLAGLRRYLRRGQYPGRIDMNTISNFSLFIEKYS
jgi:hypothetical protein